jgi:hypothetical protein
MKQNRASLMIFLSLAMAAVISAVILMNRTGGLLMIPSTTPAAFLARVPHLPLSIFKRMFILIEPSSTLLVYLLGFIMVGLGIWFVATQHQSRARRYWGIGLILWGFGAIAAGTSYQAFGYELKCRGRELCQFTSSFELGYMLLTSYSINFLVAATGYTSLGETGRKRLIRFAILDSLAYSLFLWVGAVLPVRFMISYEGFMAFLGGNFVLMFVLNIRHYVAKQDRLNLCLIWLWIGFLAVNIGYFVSLFVGFAAPLYARYGIWFNENDTLHALLILWAGQIFFSLRNSLSDSSTPPQAIQGIPVSP